MKTVSTVGAFEAKNRLSELLDRVRRGQEFVITKHDEPVARLIPADARIAGDRIRARDELRKLRERYSLKGVSVRGLIAAGRK